MKRIGIFAAAMCAAALVYACGGDDDDATGGTTVDAAGSCTSLCTDSGFTTGRADVQPNEINCFCTGGTGTVTDSRCTSMCTALKRSAGEPFGNGGAGATPSSCQCE